jgi:translation initiation factor IF-2
MNTVTLVVQKGTIRAGTILVANDIYCKVKTIYDDRMNTLGEAYPGDAVSIIGFK